MEQHISLSTCQINFVVNYISCISCHQQLLNTCYTQDFVRGIPQHKILSTPCNKNNSGTEITLKPDTSIFGEMCFEKDKIENLVKILISENQLEAKITCSEQRYSKLKISI